MLLAFVGVRPDDPDEALHVDAVARREIRKLGSCPTCKIEQAVVHVDV